MANPSLIGAPAALVADLGALSAIQVGDEVATVFVDSSGACELDGKLGIVSSIEAGVIRTKRDGHHLTIGFDLDGRTRLHLYGPVAHLSVNPAHIALVKEAEAAEQMRKAAEDVAFAARLEQSRPIGSELASEEAELVARLLANRLDSTQIATLALWLKVA